MLEKKYLSCLLSYMSNVGLFKCTRGTRKERSRSKTRQAVTIHNSVLNYSSFGKKMPRQRVCWRFRHLLVHNYLGRTIGGSAVRGSSFGSQEHESKRCPIKSLV